jgi:hypothetical protein
VNPAVLFESLAPFGPLASALWSGFAAFGWDGRLYLTAAGERYLESQDA